MKKAFMFLIACTSFQITTAQTENQLKKINSIRTEIKNNLQTYTKVKLDSGTVKPNSHFENNYYGYKFLNGGELVLKVVHNITKDESGKTTDKKVEWYFSNNKLIFSEQIFTVLESDKIIDSEKFYLDNEKLIAMYKFDKLVDINSDEFIEMAKEVDARKGNWQ